MGYRLARMRAREVLDQGRSGDILSKICDAVITFLVFANVTCVMLESVDFIQAQYGVYFSTFEVISVIIFSIEYALRIWANGSRYDSNAADVKSPQSMSMIWRGRREYMLSFHGIVDALAIAPFYLQAFFPGLDLRILRTLRLLRLFKLSHYSTAIEDLFSAIYEERRSFVAALYLLSIATVLTSTLMYFAEHSYQPEKFASIPSSIYWSIITLTTVGYGDVSPVTWIGKLISIVTAFMGVCVVALLTGIVANAFSNQMARRKVLFEVQVREALKDGLIDATEREDLEKLRVAFNLSEAQAEALFEQVQKET